VGAGLFYRFLAKRGIVYNLLAKRGFQLKSVKNNPEKSAVKTQLQTKTEKRFRKQIILQITQHYLESV